MKQNLLLIIVSLTIFVSACSPSTAPQSATEVAVPTSTKAPNTATATRTPGPATQTATATPEFDSTSTAIVNAVLTASPPRLHGSYPSPDKQWRVEVMIYDCVPVEGSVELHAYEQLNLIEVSSGDMEVIDTQFQNCGGLGAFGLEGRFWSPNSQYFYYTYARESGPDGSCAYWERPLRRLEIGSGRVDQIGMGPLSPDHTKLGILSSGA